MKTKLMKTKLTDLHPNYFNSQDTYDFDGDNLDVIYPYSNFARRDCEEIFESILIFYKVLKDNGVLPRCEKTGKQIYFDKYSILDKLFERCFETILPRQGASSFYSDFFTKLPRFVNELCRITFDEDLDDNSHFLFYIGMRIIKNLENGSRHWGNCGFGPHSDTCRCDFCYHEKSPGYVSEESRYGDYISTSNWLDSINNESLNFSTDRGI